MNTKYEQLLAKNEKIAVVGLGYVGLPIALAFAEHFDVIGFDINKERIAQLSQAIDYNKEEGKEAFENKNITFTTETTKLVEATFFVVAVPTPITDFHTPDLSPLLGASRTVGKVLKKGDYVVFESSVYPGCTEEDCIPVLEELSGLKFNIDFKVGYSPERINPGDKQHTVSNVIKVVSGSDAESTEEVAKVYEKVITAGVFRAASIKVAEAAKIIENTQRDVNIALMNELSIIFNRMNINTFDVLEAAGTKWNFLKFFPGLVGGHCIGVDPYYLTFKADRVGYHAKVINSGRYVNDSMGFYIAKQTVKKIIAAKGTLNPAKVLVMGVTFKEDVNDIRNSKVMDIVRELKSYGVEVQVSDPWADEAEFQHEYSTPLDNVIKEGYDAIIVAVSHKAYSLYEEDYFEKISTSKGVIIDVKGMYRNKIQNLTYWSL